MMVKRKKGGWGRKKKEIGESGLQRPGRNGGRVERGLTWVRKGGTSEETR